MDKCLECRMKGFIKSALDDFDFMFPDSKLNEEALKKKKEVRSAFLDGCHAILDLNRKKKEE